MHSFFTLSVLHGKQTYCCKIEAEEGYQVTEHTVLLIAREEFGDNLMLSEIIYDLRPVSREVFHTSRYEHVHTYGTGRRSIGSIRMHLN